MKLKRKKRPKRIGTVTRVRKVKPFPRSFPSRSLEFEIGTKGDFFKKREDTAREPIKPRSDKEESFLANFFFKKSENTLTHSYGSPDSVLPAIGYDFHTPSRKNSAADQYYSAEFSPAREGSPIS